MRRRMKIAMKLALATICTHGILFGNQFAQAGEVVPENSSNNTVTVNESSYTVNGTEYSFDYSLDWVYGSSRESTDAYGNTVTIDGALILYGVYGAYGLSSAYGNNVYFTDGSSSSDAFSGYGAYSTNGNVYDNTVTITNWSGESQRTYFAGAFTQDGQAYNNTITMNGGTVYTVSGAETYSGDITGNTVNINGGTVEGQVAGGVSSYTLDNSSIVNAGNITGNTINLNGGTVANVTGGSTGYDSSISDSSLISGSSVSISNNVINFYGGTVRGTISGGTGNFGESISGNTLNVYSTGLSAGSLSNLETINFYVPSSASSGDTMLTLTTSSSTDLSSTYINAALRNGTSLSVNDTITLLASNGEISTNSSLFQNQTLSGDVATNYNLSLTQSGNSIIATVDSITENEPIDVATESILVIPATVAVNEEIFPTPDIEMAGTEVETDDETGTGEGVMEEITVHADNEIFGYMGYGSFKKKLKNGGYIDTKNQGIDIGLSRMFRNSHGYLTVAPIVDYGHGSYDSYLDDGTHGEGKSSYWAGGLIARQTNNSGFYYEGALRAGRASMDFDSWNIPYNGDYAHMNYDNDTTIFSGHIRLGHIFRPRRKDSLHTYLIYSHNHQNGSNTDIFVNGAQNSHVNFSSVDSGKFKVGFRATRAVKPFSRLYTGLAYQYEFTGEASAMYDTTKNDSTKVSGSSGMLEFGWQLKPTQSSPWLFDLNTTGWVGDQKGVQFAMKVKKEF